MESQIRVSIITINLNNAKGLEQTIRSVILRNSSFIEYIVIDGGSSDNSQEVIKRYADNIDYTISENDNGIYHAMNKGGVKARGDYLLFLNSGDTLINNNSLETLLENGNDAKIIYGDIVITDGAVSKESVFPDKLTFKFFINNSLPHPCTLICRKAFNDIGGFMETLKITSDWAFFLLAINKFNYPYKHVRTFVSNFGLGGVSYQDKFKNTIAAERSFVLKKYFPCFLDDYTEYEEALVSLKKTRQQLGYRVYNKIHKVLTIAGVK